MLSEKNNTAKMPLLNKTRALKNKILLKFILVLVVLLIFYNIPKRYLGDTYPICLYRIILHKKCIGCGTTRAVWSILHLKFDEAIKYNKLVVLTFPLLSGIIIHWILKKGEKEKHDVLYKMRLKYQ
jgi:hypothetical protein